MNTLHDYFYRFPREHLSIPGRCRVRIYRRGNGSHIVLLTELASNTVESIAGACERIVTELAAARRLNPKTTRWIQHDSPHDEQPHTFYEMRFKWDCSNTAYEPLWHSLVGEEVEELTGASLHVIARHLGDQAEDTEALTAEGTEHGETEA